MENEDLETDPKSFRILILPNAGDIDAAADLGLVGFHAQLARYASTATTAPAATDTEQADDNLVADLMSAIVGSGCPFNSSRESADEPSSVVCQLA